MGRKHKRNSKSQSDANAKATTEYVPVKNREPEPSGYVIPDSSAIFETEFKELIRFLPAVFAMMVIYILTMAPTVPGGDSGELISTAYGLGVAHPPGYPLYTMVGHLFTYIPYGSIAWRVNFFSAFMTCAAACMVFLVTNRWLRSFWAATFAAILFSMSPLTWRYAVVAEVFAMNNFFIATLLYFTLRFYQEPKEKWAYAWALTLGLACSHHHTITMIAIPIFILCIIKAPQVIFSFRVFAGALGLFILGMTPYLYIPWASQKRMIISWGETDNWDGFWLHFFRKEYGTFQLATGDTNYSNVFFNIYKYSKELAMQFLFVCLVPVGVGIWQIWANKRARLRSFGWALVISCAVYLVVFHTLANMDVTNRLFYDVQSRFWMLPNLFMSIFAAVGLVWIGKNWVQELKYALPAAAVAVFVLQVVVHFEEEDMSKNTVFYDMGKSTLEPLEPNSLYLMRGDVYVNAVRYLQECEKFRTDVRAIPFDLLWWPWMKKVVETSWKNEVIIPGKVYRYERRRPGDFILSDLVNANLDRMAVYVGKLRDDEAQIMDREHRLWNIGYIYKVLNKNQEYPFEKFVADSNPFERYEVPSKEMIREKSWEAFVFYNYWDREIERSRQIFSHAMQLGVDQNWIGYGAKVLERVASDYPNPPGHVYRNLGVAYQFLAKTDGRYIPRMVEMWERYLAMNPQGDMEIEGIKALVAQNRAMINAQQAAARMQAPSMPGTGGSNSQVTPPPAGSAQQPAPNKAPAAAPSPQKAPASVGEPRRDN